MRARPERDAFRKLSDVTAMLSKPFGFQRSRCDTAYEHDKSELLDAVLLELVVQRRGLDAEQARGLGLDLLGLRVRLEDQLALEIIEDLGQRQLARHVEPIF